MSEAPRKYAGAEAKAGAAVFGETVGRSVAVHPRISVHEVCFPASMDIDAILDWCEENGISNVGLFSLRRNGDWSKAIASVNSSHVAVPYLSHASLFQLANPASWENSTAAAIATIDAAVAMGAPLVYATTGPGLGLDFEDAVEALVQAIVPVRRHAQKCGVKLLIETTPPLFCFTNFVHNFEDTAYVADKVGIELCLDLFATWYERDIHAKIRRAGDRIRLVQVSDHIPRNMSVARDVVGSGVVPVRRLLRTLSEGGYKGVVDLELFGRPDQSALADVAASLSELTRILTDLDAEVQS